MLLLSNTFIFKEMKCLCWTKPSDSRLPAAGEDNICLSLDQTKDFKLELKNVKMNTERWKTCYNKRIERVCNLHI